ncbi:MAG TPA: hypothetical protein VEP90_28700 [Methylomirabilota bacterium]|nr:hypothetical protein [Methylomirabilota bacterium]
MIANGTTYTDNDGVWVWNDTIQKWVVTNQATVSATMVIQNGIPTATTTFAIINHALFGGI